MKLLTAFTQNLSKYFFGLCQLLPLFLGFFLFLNLISLPAQAQQLGIDGLKILEIPCLIAPANTDAVTKKIDGCTEKTSLINRVTEFLKALAIPFSTLVIIWGGFQYFWGGIDGKTNGQKAIWGGVIGLLLVTGAAFFTEVVKGLIDPDGFNTTKLTPVLATLQTTATGLASVVAILVIIWGGYKYFFSGLDISKEDGLKSIRSGVIGLIVISLANVLVTALSNATKGIAAGGEGGLEAFTNALGKFVTDTVTDATGILLTLASLVAVLVIVWGGYKYFFSGLEFVKKDGLDNIKQGVLGLVVVMLAKPLVDIIDKAIPDNNQNAGGNKFLNIDISSFQTFLVDLIGKVMIPVSTLVAVFFIVLAGYYWTSAGGDDGKVKKAQTALRNAVIGLIVILLATTISQLVVISLQGTL